MVHPYRQMLEEVAWCTHVDKCLEKVVWCIHVDKFLRRWCGAPMQTNV